MWRGLKTACHHSSIPIDRFLKDVVQWQSHNPVWCCFVCMICVVEIGVDGSIVVLTIAEHVAYAILQPLRCSPYVPTITVALIYD